MKSALGIINQQALAPGLNDIQQWQAWSRQPWAIDSAASLAKLNELPMMTVHRLSSSNKLTVEYGLTTLRHYQLDAALYVSRHGKLECNYRIVHALAVGQTLSPTDFAFPVHNSSMDNLTIMIRQPIAPSPPLTSHDSLQQGSYEVFNPLQAGYQCVLMADFDGFLPELHHPQLSAETLTWPYAAALVIEADDDRQCGTQPAIAVNEATLPQNILLLQHHL